MRPLEASHIEWKSSSIEQQSSGTAILAGSFFFHVNLFVFQDVCSMFNENNYHTGGGFDAPSIS